MLEHVVPVVGRRAEAFDGRMQSDHGGGHGVAGGVGIEAAVDLASLVQQRREPARVGPGAGGREAAVVGMEGKATDGIDGRFAKDNRAGGIRRFDERGMGMAKQPRSFREPGAKPRQGRAVVPRSSAPTGRFSFPSSRKTALARASA